MVPETELDKELKLTEKEKNLIVELRKLPFGEARVVVYKQEGQPVRLEIERMKESIKL